MRLVMFGTVLAQIAMMDRISGRPASNPSSKSCLAAEGSNSHLRQEVFTESNFHREQESYLASTHTITRKDKHIKLAKANAYRAAKEGAYGFTGGVKAINYGVREGLFRAKDGLNELRNGNKRQGAKEMIKAVGKAGEGVVLSTVPIVGGLGAAVYSSGKVVKHGYSTIKASVSKPKDSSTPLQKVIDDAYVVREHTPVREQTKKFVNVVMRPNQEYQSSFSSQYSPKAGRGQG